ncbi:MAG: lysophospholipase [Candidatus Margulisbacteria bacterium]|nr:lysophospholipase [Candidatus Margulisiibacteriota bacterium]
MPAIRNNLKSLVLRGAARYGNLVYDLTSAARRQSMQKLSQRRPRSFVVPPEQIEAQTALRFSPTLQHVVKETSGQESGNQRMNEIILQGQEMGYFENFGEAIFINPRRIDNLLELIGIPADKKDLFLGEAKKHYLLREYVFAAQARGFFGSSFRVLDRGNYIDREYHILTRDARTLSLTRIVNQDRVKTKDQSPSVLFIPGLACNHGFYDLNNETSLALEHADQGRWVYLFDPRGLGRNKGDFDPHCFLDTLVSNDLPATVEFIANRPTPHKPVVLIGHSMGGMVAEFMLVRQAYKLNQLAQQISKMIADPTFVTKGKTRVEITGMLEAVEARLGNERKTDHEIRALIDEARGNLEILNAVKGLITLGSPKIFDRNEHPIYPLLLMLNILLPIIGEDAVPVDKAKLLLKLMPRLSLALHLLINPKNFDDPKAFLTQLAEEGTDSFPLGVGLQLLKAVYSGKGVRRMGQDRFNYSAHLDEIPPDIPIFHIAAPADPLAPAFNMGFIDRRYVTPGVSQLASFPEYSHTQKRVYHINQSFDPAQLPLSDASSQVTGFLVEGVNHLDFFYGRTGERVVRPLLNRLVDLIWQA